MKQLTILSLTAALIFMTGACSTPEAAIKQGNYKKALNVAANNISQGKDVERNEAHLQQAAKALTVETILFSEIYDSGIEDWDTNQDRLDNSLSLIGDKNILTQGAISASYDKLSEAKRATDLKIVEYYYTNGKTLLQQAIQTGESSYARDAYDQFVKSEEEGASLFYIAPEGLTLPDKFVKRVSAESGVVPDCVVTLDYTLPVVKELSNISETSVIRKTIQRRHPIKNSKGEYKPDILELIAYKTEKEIQYEGSLTLSVEVTANTSQCFLSSRDETFLEKKVCNEVTFTGDERAHRGDKICPSGRIVHTLKNDLKNRLNNELYVN